MKRKSIMFWLSCCAMTQLATAQSNVTNLNWTQSVPTRFGTVMVKATNDDGQKLYLNKTVIDLSKEGDSFSLNLLSKIARESDEVVIVWGGSGGTMDNDSNIHCKFVTISGKTQYRVSVLTYCPRGDSIKYESGIVSYNFVNPLPYAFESDVGLLSFANNKVTIVQSIKAEKYYRQQYANYAPQQIYAMIAADGGGNASEMLKSVEKNKMWCHACGSYGARYCQPFNWMKNPPHDKYYQQLKSLCTKPIY